MCFYSRQSKTAQELESRFNAKIENETWLQPTVYNGFQFPKTPVITHQQTGAIQFFSWGLVPFWAKDDSIRKSTLNARIETIHEKPSFRDVANSRCLVLADGFYEWQWLDEKGRRKQKYELTLPDNEPFAFAGIYGTWTNKVTGEIINSYAILTTVANELMSTIHNTKKRMPIIVSADSEQDWLNGRKLKMQNDRLTATAV